jgi:hypothetical protein
MNVAQGSSAFPSLQDPACSSRPPTIGLGGAAVDIPWNLSELFDADCGRVELEIFFLNNA